MPGYFPGFPEKDGVGLSADWHITKKKN